MKKVLLLIAFVLFAVTSAFAQKKKLGYIDDAYGKAAIQTEFNTRTYNLTAGQLFQRASKEFLISTGCAIVSGGACVLGASLDNKDASNATFIAGGIFGLASLVMGVKGCITLGKAGKALDRERPVAYLKPASSGVGINLTF